MNDTTGDAETPIEDDLVDDVEEIKKPLSLLLLKDAPLSGVNRRLHALQRRKEIAMVDVASREDNDMDWLVLGLEEFNDETTWGLEWFALLANWVLFETDEGYAGVGVTPIPCRQSAVSSKKKAKKLPDMRPPLLVRWMKDGRWGKYEKLPRGPVGNGGALFEEHWTMYDAWWDWLQPEWRGRSASGNRERLPKWQSKFDKLNTRGRNGWLSIIVSLWWWGDALRQMQGTEQQWAVWRDRIKDALWVIEGIRIFGRK